MTLTPEQFNTLATKDDLRRFVTKEYFDRKMDRLLTAFDRLATDIKDLKQKLLMNQAAQGRFDRRIGQSEKVLKLKPMIV